MRDRGWVLRFAPVGDIVHLDGVAGRKLSERRDLLGMAGLVRYADHHDGHLAGWAMSGLLWAHAASRAAGFWAVASTTRNDERRQGATARHEHFLRVLKRYREVRELAGLRPATTTGT